MPKKNVIMSKHAAERLLERKVPLKLLEKMLKNGVKIGDRESGATLCIYNIGSGKYYTLVLDEEPEQMTIITGYESSEWQISRYAKVKKDERSKMR